MRSGRRRAEWKIKADSNNDIKMKRSQSGENKASFPQRQYVLIAFSQEKIVSLKKFYCIDMPLSGLFFFTASPS